MKRGDKIGRYELGEQIGEGAMASVFASRHPVLDQLVAVKVLKREACHDAHYVARFLEDARAAHRLDHPNIVRVYDVDEAAGRPFIVMELVDGQSLDAWMAGRRVEVREAVRIARDLARALSVAHADGLVHRDVKPSNVLMDAGSGVAKLTDFGAAKRDRPGAQQLTEIGQRIGTPRYMAPEQVEGAAVDARTDLFALGATLYELLAGRPAFEASSVSAAFHAILFATPPPLGELRPDAPAELTGLVERLLAKAPEARPASAAEVAAVLDGLLEVDATAAKAQPIEEAPVQSITQQGATGAEDTTPAERGMMLRSRLLPAAAAVVLLIVVGAGAWWWLSPAPEPDLAVATEPESGAGAPAEEAGESAAPEAESPAPEPEAEAAAAESQPKGALQPQEGVAPEPDADAAAEPEVAEATPRWEEETSADAGASGGSPEPEPSVAEATPRWEPDQEGGAGAPESEAGAATAAARLEEAPAEPVTSQEEITAQLAPGIGAAPATSEAEAPPAAPVQIPDCPPDGAAPGCALAAEALRTMAATPVSTPAVNLNRPDGIYLDEEYLVVEMKLPEELGGYVYVDVLTDAGSVYHLLPEPLRADNELQPGGVMRVGVEAEERRDGVRHWQVSEPFGDAYLLVLVSEKPIYEDLRPIAEPLDSYRDVLLEALADPDSGEKSVYLRRVEFRPR